MRLERAYSPRHLNVRTVAKHRLRTRIKITKPKTLEVVCAALARMLELT